MTRPSGPRFPTEKTPRNNPARDHSPDDRRHHHRHGPSDDARLAESRRQHGGKR